MVSAPDSTVGESAGSAASRNDEREEDAGGADDHGQPKETLARIRPAFRKHLRPHTKDRDRSVEGCGSSS